MSGQHWVGDYNDGCILLMCSKAPEREGTWIIMQREDSSVLQRCGFCGAYVEQHVEDGVFMLDSGVLDRSGNKVYIGHEVKSLRRFGGEDVD